MNGLRQRALPLFRFNGIQVSLHWSWFLVAAYEIGGRERAYSSLAWNVAEYLALFLIVMIHEFGHALACRQVGGIANQIVLWPLGGVAYVNPPPRPGATLWSIAAGPLVNVALVPVLWVAGHTMRTIGMAQTAPDAFQLVRAVFAINLGLLVFNVLPVYPLDGGQILRSLLWFVLGRGRSLMVATVVGFIGVGGLILLAIKIQEPWLAIISVFILMNCWRGLQQARALLRLAKLPRQEGFSCPTCKTSPPIGEFWRCSTCGKPFDTFRYQAVCPNCSAHFATTGCIDCGRAHPIGEWMVSADAPRPV